MGDRLTDVFLQLFCEKNSDGTRNLRLKGRELWQRIGKRLVAEDMEKVAAFMKNNPDIVKLDLSYNDIGDKGIEFLVDGYLVEAATLKHLNIMSCSLTWEGTKKLCDAADSLTSLEVLRINGNKIGPEGGKFVSMVLGSSSSLKLLDAGDTDQTVGGILYFLSMIREDIGTNKTLKVLDLSRIVPDAETYQYSPEVLALNMGLMLRVNSILTELHLQKCEFDGHDVEQLLLGLYRNKSLLLLDLGYNRICDFGIELLADWLQKKPPLLGLIVPANSICDAGARALSFGMPYSKLRLLDIGYNKISDKGLTDILNSLKKPYMLRTFYFWGNEIAESSHRVIDRMLSSGVLEQENIDVKLYVVDGVICSAFYPTNHYKHRYYCVLDKGVPTELRIKRNKIQDERAAPRALYNFEYYDRLPDINEDLPLLPKPC